MIETFKEFIHQRLCQWLGEKSSLHPLFVHPKPRWNASDEVWFVTIPIGCNQLCLIVDKLTLSNLC